MIAKLMKAINKKISKHSEKNDTLHTGDSVNSASYLSSKTEKRRKLNDSFIALKLMLTKNFISGKVTLSKQRVHKNIFR